MSYFEINLLTSFWVISAQEKMKLTAFSSPFGYYFSFLLWEAQTELQDDGFEGSHDTLVTEMTRLV